MEDESPNTMSLDLNLMPNDNSSNDSHPEVDLSAYEDMLVVNRTRAVNRHRRRHRIRPVWTLFQDSSDARNRNLALRLNDGVSLHVGEGSIAAEERPSNGTKTCDNNDVCLDDALEKKDDEEKGTADTGSFFDCNICLDMANDPVVTCCGHLFCWPCLYRWLHLHSDAKECPFCKGEVTLKNVTPIYGRGESVRQPVDDINLKIPLRPQARRVESSRQVIQRQVIQRFDLSQVQPQHVDAPRESPERSLLERSQLERSLLNQYLTSRRTRGERISPISHETVHDDSIPSSAYFRRAHAGLAATFEQLISFGDDRLIESFLPNEITLERSQEGAQAVDDRDSMSSIAAIIQSDSQTVDTTFSTLSTSRRRNNVSRVSDVDSGDSLRLRRQRLN